MSITNWQGLTGRACEAPTEARLPTAAAHPADISAAGSACPSAPGQRHCVGLRVDLDIGDELSLAQEHGKGLQHMGRYRVEVAPGCFDSKFSQSQAHPVNMSDQTTVVVCLK